MRSRLVATAWIVAPLIGGLAIGGLVVGDAARAQADGKPPELLERVERLEEQAAGKPVDSPAEPLQPGEAAAVDPEGRAPLDDPLSCLARTIYWEAKGEGEEAMEAVANVVMNRLATEDFPDRVCAVVREGKESGPCQFGWWCDGRADAADELDQYEIAIDVARRALNQELQRRTDGALFFHGLNDNPEWATRFTQTTKIGSHVFYRPNETTAE